MKKCTNTKQVLNMLYENEMIERIDEFRYNNRIPTRTEAIRFLIEFALENYKQEK